MEAFFTLFLVTTLQSTTAGQPPLIHYDDITQFESRIKCEEARIRIMVKYLPPGPGVALTCIRTDQT